MNASRNTRPGSLPMRLDAPFQPRLIGDQADASRLLIYRIGILRILSGLGGTLDLMHAALPLRFTCTLPRRCMQVFVVLLRFFCDGGKEKRLLPCGRLTGTIKPSVGRLTWTTQRRDDHGSRIRGEGISEGHGQILPPKKKSAMQKINLDKCPQCRQSTRMSNNSETFKGRFGKIDGKTVWIVNSGMAPVKATGEMVKAYKVRFRLPKTHTNAGFDYAPAKWVRAEKVQ